MYVTNCEQQIKFVLPKITWIFKKNFDVLAIGNGSIHFDLNYSVINETKWNE
jgi:hypothetical protein